MICMVIAVLWDPLSTVAFWSAPEAEFIIHHQEKGCAYTLNAAMS